MKKILLYMFLSLVLSGCELYVIGTERKKAVEINQKSALGVVYLFKTELDSNNVKGATEVLAPPTGNYYLAIEKYDMFLEMERMARIIGHKPITDVVTDTLSTTNQQIKIEFDYLTEVSFTASKIHNYWYIIDYKESKRYY